MPVVDKEKTAAPEEATAFDHKYRLTTEQYYKMGEADIFGDDKRIELIDGILIKMPRITPQQSYYGGRLFSWIMDEFYHEHYPGHRHPITIADGTEPVPDTYIAKGPWDQYETRHPEAADLLLIVEVSDSTLASDRKRKLSCTHHQEFRSSGS